MDKDIEKLIGNSNILYREVLTYEDAYRYNSEDGKALPKRIESTNRANEKYEVKEKDKNIFSILGKIGLKVGEIIIDIITEVLGEIF
ncbi:hypothetical protein JCM1393_03320 [Clostridium carnis]